jgi:hypothetical protein
MALTDARARTAAVSLLIAAACIAQRANAQTSAQTAPAPLREVLRISGSAEDITGSATTVQVLRNSGIAFFDHGTGQFVFFDSAGKRIGTFGRSGDGPGEFGRQLGRTYPIRTGTLGDSLWTYNLTQRRFTLIGPDMKLVRTYQQPGFVPPVAALNPLATLSGERLLARVDYGERIRVTTPDGRESTTWKASDSAIVVLAKDGAVEKRVMPMPPTATTVPVMRPGSPVAVRNISVPFRGSRLLSNSPNGDLIAFATSTAAGTAGTFTVTVVRSTGEQVYSRSFSYTPTPVTKRMYDSAWARVDSTFRTLADAPNNPDVLQKVRDLIPASLDPFRDLRVGIDGTIWLRRDLPNDVPAEYLMIDPGGTLLRPIHMPRKGLTLMTGTRSTIWATESDADGFLSVVRMVVGR